jgi:mannose-6-phosphate isomerase-like protein (cupin superfamily)
MSHFAKTGAGSAPSLLTRLNDLRKEAVMSEPAASPGAAAKEVIFLAPGAGRHYHAGPMHAVFKADGAETADRYCVSEWWLQAGDSGPGPHSHEDNVELFYVIEGTMSFLAGDRWMDAPAGSFLRVPAGVTHDFENRTTERAGVLNVFLPGGFEVLMPAIVDYFAKQGDADRAAPR